MTQDRTIKITMGVVAVVLGLLLLWGLQVVIGAAGASLMLANWPTLTPLEARFQALQLKLEDLPSGWSKGGANVETVPGAAARFLWYYGPSGESKTWVNVSEELILYPDAEASANAYGGWVIDNIPPAHANDWISPPGLKFSGQADQMIIRCLPGYIDGLHHYACKAIGRYGDVVVTLRANIFDDRWLTMADFQTVLEAMDRRIVAAGKANQ